MGVNPSAVRKWCANSSLPDVASLLKIADLLEVDIKELLVREYEQFPILHSLVKSYIVEIRQKPVIVDADVAALYGVETKRINEAVKNNPDKFPEDYMFVLTTDELKDLRSKFSTTNLSVKSRSLPKVFTEKGLYMLATIVLTAKDQFLSLFNKKNDGDF